jgi:PAS domain S-box-containing protein
VLFLNDLRHRGGTALNFRIPLSETDVPAVMAVLGQRGVVQGRDYRGVEVLSALKAIPESSWYMVAKVDAEEAFSVLRRESILILALLLGILAASAAGLGVFWQRREKAYFQAMFEAEAKRRESEARYRTILETAMDGFWLVDKGGRLLEVNEAYCRMSGYEKEELTAMSIPDLEATMTAGEVASRIQQIMLQGGDRFQSRHRRKDGSVFDVEVSAQYGPMEEGRFVAFVSDITERKQAENVLTYLARCQAAPGGDFFRSLGRYLAETLAMDYVCIDRLEGDRLAAHTVAVYSDGRFEDNVSYTLKDTPCGDVVDQDICCFPSGVRHLFPRDVVLQEMGAESYVGVTLRGYAGRLIGLIAVIGRRPLSNPRLAEFLLKLVAERAAGELERNKTEEDLRKAHEDLEIRVRERTSELSTTVEMLEAEISRGKELEETLRESERQVRFFAAQCLTAQEEERRRIARDLHDSLAGSLAALRFSMEKTQREMEKGSATPDALREPISSVEQNIREVRRIMAELRPSVLDDLGIVATIHWFCREFQKTYSHIRVESEMGLSEDDVPPALKTVIFRIAQEAMNNVAKHSGATLVKLSLRRWDGKVALTIRDNGKGFNVGEVLTRRDAERGLGLPGMRERAQLSAGVMSVESEGGGGTIVQVLWPFMDEIKRAAPGAGAAG